MNFYKIFLFLPLITLYGCLTGNQSSHSDNGTTITNGPTIYKQDETQRLEDKVENDKRKQDLKDEIIASSNSTKNQLSGMVTTSISKLGEEVKGIEAHISDLIKIENNLSIEARADINATLKAVTEIKVQLENTVNINNRMQNNMDDLVKVVITLQANLQAQAQAQVGIGNRLESKIERLETTITSTAGRDVNMFPPQAVDVIVSSWRLFIIIIAIIFIAICVYTTLRYKFSKDEMKHHYEYERQRADEQFKLLQVALMNIPPERVHLLEKQMMYIKNGEKKDDNKETKSNRNENGKNPTTNNTS